MTGTKVKSNRRQNNGVGKNDFSTNNSTDKSRRKLSSLEKLKNKFSRSVREEHSTGETGEEGHWVSEGKHRTGWQGEGHGLDHQDFN